MIRSWKIRGGSLSLEKTAVMGILNLTPDSFSDGGRFLDPAQAVLQARQMLEEGAAILDLGAESTRPGAEAVSEDEELKRLLPVLDSLVSLGAVVSIDTTKPRVAQICLEHGARIINDVSGLKDSGEAMADLAAKTGAGIVLMHRRGNPATMQSLAQYGNVTEDVLKELRESLEIAKQAGLDPGQIAVDPGIGFAKNADQNWELLRHLPEFHTLGHPVLLGASRKSFLGSLTGRDVLERDYATAALSTFAVLNGIQIIRVHDVAATRDAVRVAEALKGETQHVRA